MIKKFWALALFAGNEPFFSRLVDLLHFTCIFSKTFLQVKQKVSRMEFRFRTKSGNKTFDEPSYRSNIYHNQPNSIFSQQKHIHTQTSQTETSHFRLWSESRNNLKPWLMSPFFCENPTRSRPANPTCR